MSQVRLRLHRLQTQARKQGASDSRVQMSGAPLAPQLARQPAAPVWCSHCDLPCLLVIALKHTHTGAPAAGLQAAPAALPGRRRPLTAPPAPWPSAAWCGPPLLVPQAGPGRSGTVRGAPGPESRWWLLASACLLGQSDLQRRRRQQTAVILLSGSRSYDFQSFSIGERAVEPVSRAMRMEGCTSLPSPPYPLPSTQSIDFLCTLSNVMAVRCLHPAPDA